VRQIRDSGLKFHTIVKRAVTVTQAREDVVLEGRLEDVNLAISDIKDALAELVRGTLDSWNHVNGSSSSAVDRSSEKLNPDGAQNDRMAGRQRSTFVRMDTDHDQVTSADKHQSVNNIHPVTAAANLEKHQSQIEIDEHIWHYIAFKYPDMYKHWEQTLLVSPNTSTKVIDIAGQLQDVVNFAEFYKKHDLTSVVRRVIKVGSDVDVNRLKILVDSSEAGKFGVCVQFVRSTEMECIGKERDTDGFISWLRAALRDFKEHKVNGSDVEDSARVNASVPIQEKRNMAVKVSSHVNSPDASASSVTHKTPVIIHTGQGRLKFKTAESQLDVEVLQGNLIQQQSQVIVNPANKLLLHNGGAAKAIQTAAGRMLITECKEYIRMHKELPTSEVMHTTAGKLPRPINFVIHACGPNARDYPDDKQCLQLLEKTFLNCFMHANDVLCVQSIALPAISSGTIFVLFCSSVFVH